MTSGCKFYLFSHLGGVDPSWSLAVLATSERDAKEYVKRQHGHGKLDGVVERGKVDAFCGAATEAATLRIRGFNRREYGIG